MSNTKIVKEAMSKGSTFFAGFNLKLFCFFSILKFKINLGALVYLLDLFCNSTNAAVRTRTSELFSKMMADKLIGPRVKIVLSKFLPSIFMDAMRDSPDASVHMFEGTIKFSLTKTVMFAAVFLSEKYTNFLFYIF